MLLINVNGNIEKALKDLKRKVSKTKQLQQLRDRKEFKKPSVEKRDTLKKAIYKQRVRTQTED
jgi:small subunit ribosomal protein S21